MWLTLLFGAVNFLFAFVGRRLLKLPGFDLTPIAMIILARSGENVLFAALALTAALALSGMDRARYLWLTLPATVLVGFLAKAMGGVLLLLALYHGVCFAFAFMLGFFGFRYALFVLVNFGLNLAVGRLYELVA